MATTTGPSGDARAGDLKPGIRILTRGQTPNLDPTFQISERLRSQLRDEVVKPFERHAWVYAALHRIATNISQVPIGVFVETADDARDEPAFTERQKLWVRGRGVQELAVRRKPPVLNRYINASPLHRIAPQIFQRELQEVEGSKWTELFQAPNPYMTGLDLWYLTLIHMYTSRGAFWVLLGKDGKPRKEGEHPSEIWPQPADAYTPDIDDGRSELLTWTRNLGGRKEILEPHQVARFGFPNPSNPLQYLSPLDPMAADLRQDAKASRFNEAFFDNDGEISTVLETASELTDVQAKALQQQWDSRHRGAGQRNKTAVAHSGLSVNKVGISQKDMDFLEQRRWNRGAVLATTGVPEAELSIYENLIESNAISQNRAFWEKTLIPVMRTLEASAYPQLFQGAQFVLFNLTAVRALQALFSEQVEQATKLFAMGYPSNEINQRLDMGLSSHPWGDVGYLPRGLAPAPSLSEEPSLSDDEPTGETPSPEGEPTPTQDEPTPEPEENPEGSEPENLPGPGSGASLSRAVGGPAWRRVITRVFDPSERRFQKVIRRWTVALRREQLDLLEEAAENGNLGAAIPEAEVLYKFLEAEGWKTKVITPGSVESILFSLDEWGKRLTEATRPQYEKVAALSFEQLEDELGGIFNFDLTHPRLLTFLSEKEIKVQKVAKTIQENVRNEVIKGLAQGESPGAIQERVKRAFNFAASPARTLRVARTEVAQTQGGVRNLTFEEEGVEKQQWLTAGDEAVRDDHVILGGTSPQPLGHNYMEDLGKPGVLTYPSDPQGPAGQIINCRCVPIAVR